MNIVLTSLGFLVAVFCAAIMGFAIQRGATCTVAAVDEVVNKRRFQRLISVGEASLWVLGGLLIAKYFGLLTFMPAGICGWCCNDYRRSPARDRRIREPSLRVRRHRPSRFR